MNMRQSSILAAWAGVAWSLSAGCEQKPPPPPAPAPPPATASAAPQRNDTELAALRSFVAGDSPRNAAALPDGHPPISGAAPPPRPTAAASSVKFTAPPEWKPQTPSGAMRKAQYALPAAEGDTEDAELVVFYFGPGEGGNVTDNLVRWRGQVTAADGSPLPADASTEERFDADKLKVVLLDVSGRYAPGALPGRPDPGPRDGYRMLAAVIETPGGPWFVKVTGPARTMAQHREAVRKFLASAAL
jgi:hypothetical protein